MPDDEFKINLINLGPILKEIKAEEDKAFEQAIKEVCKLQLAAYKDFISLGCSPAEAMRQTVAHTEAFIRAGGPR